MFSLKFSGELLLIKILTRDSYFVYIVETGGLVNAGFNKTPAVTAHIGRQLRDSKLCLTISLHYLSSFTQDNLISADLDDSNLIGTPHGTEMAPQLLYEEVVLKLVRKNNLRTVTPEAVFES